MSKTRLGGDDFVIAGKTKRKALESSLSAYADNSIATPRNMSPTNVILRLSEEERRAKNTSRAIESEDARLALKQLKRAKERHAKFYVNVALSYDLKNRLKRAAHENDINMTIIMQAAIESYLIGNGY